jgi:3-deoxy-D-manno-octulosonic-acid transferase
MSPLLLLYRAAMAVIYWAARLANILLRSPGLRERFGFYPPEEVQKISVGYNVWLHAASGGEVNAIAPFCKAFRKARPEAKIILTTTSETGKKLALEKGVADTVFLAPLDTGGPLKRAFNTFRPVMVLIAETEFWPNWFLRTGHNGIPLVLVNGRISDKSFPSYMRLRSLFGKVLTCFNICLVQTPIDQQRLTSLGVSPARIQVAGQMKYDISAPDPAMVGKFKNELGLKEGDILFTLGSLREGEDDLLLPLVPEILRFSPKVKVVVAPRHLKNALICVDKLTKNKIPCVLRSGLGKSAQGERVVVLDTFGELSLSYQLSRAAFVGGTLVEVGGHNVMEPALSGVPVCFGPHTQNVREAADALTLSGGGVPLKDATELVGTFQKWMDQAEAKSAGLKARDAVSNMSGATGRTVEMVLERWNV